MASSLLSPTPSKPASFFQDAVRHIHIDVHSDWSPDILRVCTRTQNLASILVDPTLLPILLQMDLRRLALSLKNLFSGWKHVDMTHPGFARLTHLDVFDDDIEEDLQIVPHVAALPALTHLCLNNGIPRDIMRAVLLACPRLQVLVSCWHYAKASAGRDLAHNPPLADPRFVVGIYRRYDLDWESGAKGGPDFWSLADDFVARKRDGEVPGTCDYFHVALNGRRR